MNQQALHGQPMNQVPQSMVHLQGARKKFECKLGMSFSVSNC